MSNHIRLGHPVVFIKLKDNKIVSGFSQTHTYIYIYIYICVCVCVCVCEEIRCKENDRINFCRMPVDVPLCTVSFK